MLGKLLKYDIKSQSKSLLPLYLVVLVFAGATRGMNLLVDQFPVLSMIYTFMVSLCVVSLIGIVVWTFIVAVKQFYFNILKDEGYLTNTLPVTRNQIILSKEITSIIFMVLVTAVVIGGIMITFYHGGMKSFLDEMVAMFDANGVETTHFFAWMIVLMVLSYISYVQMAFTSLMFGQMKNTNKILFAVVAAILIYIVQSICSFIMLGIDMVISPDLMKVMDVANPALADVWKYMELIFISTTVFTIIFIVLFHIVSVVIANRKLNLE